MNCSAGEGSWGSLGLQRKLSAEELMLLNCDAGEDSWESFVLQGDKPVIPEGN